MGKKNNSIIISGILVAFLVGTIVSSPSASAANPVIALITEQVIPKLNQIITDITALTTGVSATTETQIDNIETGTNKIQMDIAALTTGVSATTETQIDNIETETNKIQMVKNNQYIPFIETISGGICTLGATATFSSITINSNADPGTPFVVTSIVMKPTGLLGNHLDLEEWTVDDTTFFARTVRLDTDSTNRDSVGFDIMGIPLGTGGNFPTQIVAESHLASDDIEIKYLCVSPGAGGSLDFDKIQVSGWITAGDSVTVLQIP